MSAVIAAEATDAPVPVKVGKKKLIIIVAAALVLLLAIGGGVGFWLKHKAAKAAAEAEEGGEHAVKKVDPHFVPVFLPLDPFVINLADKEADRFAQIGITLELENAASSDRIKAYMPAVRNAILLLIAGKTSQALGDRQGKEVLAQEILREAVRPLGFEVPEPKAVTPAAAPEAAASAPKETKETKDEAVAEDESSAEDGDAEHGKKVKGNGKTKAKAKADAKAGDGHDAEKSPIVRVHFSSFIIQ